MLNLSPRWGLLCGALILALLSACQLPNASDPTILVKTITVSCPDGYDVQTGQATFVATVAPSQAENQAVTWSLVSISNGFTATISASGQLQVSSGSGNGVVVVKARAKDGSGVSGTMSLNIQVIAE